MQILNSLTISPFTLEDASTIELVRVWDSEAGRASNEVELAAPLLDTARRGGIEIAADAPRVGRDADDVKRGVSAARPGVEAGLALEATRNQAGVNSTINNAVKNSGDPRFNAPPPNYGAAEAGVAGAAGGIKADGREVSRRAGEAQRLENDIFSRRI